MRDDLGDRIKANYEYRARYMLPRRTYTILRLDGCAFHTFTKKLNKPFDRSLIEAMVLTTERLVKDIQGAQFGYTQSDEISILLTDFNKEKTNAWFDGNIQKMVSVAASMASSTFNHHWQIANPESRLALFDARTFTIPDSTEVENYFIWRNKDCERNSINSAAQSLFSHKELQGKGIKEVQELMFSTHNINWATYYKEDEKNGTVVYYKDDEWQTKPGWRFTEKRNDLKELIPRMDNEVQVVDAL